MASSVETAPVLRPATAAEVPLFADWAAAEGWNPGLGDMGVFQPTDPAGFLVAEVAGEAVATVSVVRFDADFAFLGFYIVRPDKRGQGVGWRLWQAGIAHAGGRRIGLDGVVDRQADYARSGFRLAWNNARFAGTPDFGPPVLPAGTRLVPYGDRHAPALAALDRAGFPADRADFLHRWATAPGHRALVLEEATGTAVAAGVARPCREGVKIGPLYAPDREVARSVLAGLAAALPGRPLFLDVPTVNPAAVALAEGLGMRPVFQTARMWTGDPPTVDPGTLFGVCSFELG